MLTLLMTALPGGGSKYMEVGFNAGHSSAMVLQMFKNAKVTAFDLCAHDYTRPAFEELKSYFGESRINLICGHSHEEISRFSEDVRNSDGGGHSYGGMKELQSFDAIFIDAGHLYVDAWLDILDSAKYAKPSALIIVDDCSTDFYSRDDGKILSDHNMWEFHVSLAFRHAVASKIIEPLPADVCGDCDLCVGRVKKHQTDMYRQGLTVRGQP